MATRIPNAWDDDYVSVADSKSKPDPTPAQVTRPSRAERKAQHAASQKALWDTAENQNDLPFFLHARNTEPPLKTNHRGGPVQLLSRKPKEVPKGPVLARRKENDTMATGLERGVNGMSIAQNPQHGEEEELDSEDEARLEAERTLKERQERARAEREEKVRKYEETRRRIFGEGGGGGAGGGDVSGAASPNGRARGSSRGGRGGAKSASRPTSAAQSPARAQQQRQLFDPDSTAMARPGPSAARGSVQSPGDAQILRQPRGPDGSGRGGFGFAQRGGASGVT